MDSEGILLDIVRGNLGKYVGRLRDRIEYLESTLEHVISNVNIQTRLQAQWQASFNLIAQVDMKVLKSTRNCK